MGQSTHRVAITLMLAMTVASSCVAPTLREQERALEAAQADLGRDPLASPGAEPEGAPGASIELDGSLEAYVAHAYAHSPELEARYARWRAETRRIRGAARLPDPTVRYTGFILPVETRGGPQRHRVSVQQRFPWPTQITAARDAASQRAWAQQQAFEAEALRIRERVVTAYWRLWLVREVEAVEAEQREVLAALSEAARARLETGRASLADLQQTDLQRVRLQDELDGLDEQERGLGAMLLGAAAVDERTEAPTRPTPPELREVAESPDELLAAIEAHPDLERLELLAQAHEQQARAEEGKRRPGFSLSVDWIEIGPGPDPAADISGRDALGVGVGIEVPVWGRAEKERAEASRAEASARRADRAALRLAARTELEVQLAAVRDSARRAQLHESTLVPQATGVLESRLGQYAVGEGTLDSILIAQRDLVALEEGLARARAEHAVAWARLERVVGRQVRSNDTARVDGGTP